MINTNKTQFGNLQSDDVKNLEECLDIDRAFDEVWYEKYPELDGEEE